MVVDDDQEMVRLLRTLFEMESYDVIVTRAYRDILGTLRESQPDVLLMDVRVQGRETIGLMSKIREDAGLAEIPVVMTSGMDRRRECLDAKADLFIMKPFLPDALIEMVGGLLKE
jgi:CheY-like chemotaxis protein